MPLRGPDGLVDPAATSGIGRLLVTTSDPAVVPNDGLRTNLTAFAPRTFDTFTSYQEGVAETIGLYDAVFGIFENYQGGPVPFFSVFSNTTDATVHLAYWSTMPLLTGASYDFALERTNGTVWTLTMNGDLFGANESAGTFDFGANESTWAGGLSFSEIALYGNMTTAPPSAPASLAIATHTATGWYLPTSGVATFSGPAPWGIEGRAQHPTLAPGAIVSGTELAAVVNGTVLWTGGRVSVAVALTTPSNVVGLSAYPVTASVSTLAGAPLPGVGVYLSDARGGNFTPTPLVTNASGAVYAIWATPNVSANASDLLTANVTTFGYAGFASGAVAVAAPLHILLRVEGDGAVPPGGSSAITFHATDPGGHDVAGILLNFLAIGGAVAPGDGITDEQGRASVTVSTTATSGTLTVLVTVSGTGVWGSTSAVLPVRAPPAVPWDLYLGLTGAAVVLAAVALWWWRRPRHRRPTSEELWGPSLRRPPPTRTPPGSGAP